MTKVLLFFILLFFMATKEWWRAQVDKLKTNWLVIKRIDLNFCKNSFFFIEIEPRKFGPPVTAVGAAGN